LEISDKDDPEGNITLCIGNNLESLRSSVGRISNITSIQGIHFNAIFNGLLKAVSSDNISEVLTGTVNKSNTISCGFSLVAILLVESEDVVDKGDKGDVIDVGEDMRVSERHG
jgi:hypothetical protein